MLARTGQRKVVYHSSHDEAGNGDGTARTIVIAANAVELQGEVLQAAEARCRTVLGLSVLSAGTPMFFMGEEVGAARDYRYDTFLNNREDLRGLRAGRGRNLFRFYQELIRLRLTHEALRSRDIELLYTHDVNRVLAFRRQSQEEELLIIASLNERPLSEGYELPIPSSHARGWREIFNSDAERYGGSNVGNLGGDALPSGERAARRPSGPGTRRLPQGMSASGWNVPRAPAASLTTVSSGVF